jgi:tetratricopeptide (TPR) repeat protein
MPQVSKREYSKPAMPEKDVDIMLGIIDSAGPKGTLPPDTKLVDLNQVFTMSATVLHSNEKLEDDIEAPDKLTPIYREPVEYKEIAQFLQLYLNYLKDTQRAEQGLTHNEIILNSAKAKYLLGVIESQQGNYEKTITRLEEAIQTIKAFPQAELMLSSDRQESKAFQNLRHYQEELALTLYRQGIQLESSNKHTEAAEYFKKSDELCQSLPKLISRHYTGAMSNTRYVDLYDLMDDLYARKNHLREYARVPAPTPTPAAPAVSTPPLPDLSARTSSSSTSSALSQLKQSGPAIDKMEHKTSKEEVANAFKRVMETRGDHFSALVAAINEWLKKANDYVASKGSVLTTFERVKGVKLETKVKEREYLINAINSLKESIEKKQQEISKLYKNSHNKTNLIEINKQVLQHMMNQLTQGEYKKSAQDILKKDYGARANTEVPKIEKMAESSTLMQQFSTLNTLLKSSSHLERRASQQPTNDDPSPNIDNSSSPRRRF